MKTILIMRSPTSGSHSFRSCSSRANNSSNWSFGIVASHCPACFTVFLLTCLLEDIAHVLLVGEVADTLGTHDITRPFSSDKLVKQSEVEWLAAVIDEGSDTIFLCLAFLMVVIMMVVVMMVMFVFVVIVVVMMMLVLIVLLIVLVVIVVVMLFLFFLLAVALSFDFLNPSC